MSPGVSTRPQSAHERETTLLRVRAEAAEAGRDAAIADRSAGSLWRITGALRLRPAPHVDERGVFCRPFDLVIGGAAGVVAGGVLADRRARGRRAAQGRYGTCCTGRGGQGR